MAINISKSVCGYIYFVASILLSLGLAGLASFIVQKLLVFILYCLVIVLTAGAASGLLLDMVAFASTGPLALLRGVLWEIVNCLSLVVIVSVLIQVTGRVGVVVAAVHAEGTAAVSLDILLLFGEFVATMALRVPHLLVSACSEILWSTLAELVLVENGPGSGARVPTRLTVTALLEACGVGRLVLAV